MAELEKLQAELQEAVRESEKLKVTRTSTSSTSATPDGVPLPRLNALPDVLSSCPRHSKVQANIWRHTWIHIRANAL